MSIVAFIPARSGSKRVPNKNIRVLGGHPLLAYTIRAAIDSGMYDAVVCVTDCPKYAAIAEYYGAEVPFLRPIEISGDQSPDIDWVVWMLLQLKTQRRSFDIFSILRPTSPFRLPKTIQQACQAFRNNQTADSLRAIEKCKQHPGKMWVIRGGRLLPLIPFNNDSTPWHSSQYAALPEVYSQNASFEIAWSRIALEQNTIAGQVIVPFISSGLEGFDINDPDDWMLAELYIAQGRAKLPTILLPPFEKFD
jgi:CMP-N,N'-diacetyllegionaminic acid synthase